MVDYPIFGFVVTAADMRTVHLRVVKSNISAVRFCQSHDWRIHRAFSAREVWPRDVEGTVAPTSVNRRCTD
jgi:hypothetical protein